MIETHFSKNSEAIKFFDYTSFKNQFILENKKSSVDLSPLYLRKEFLYLQEMNLKKKRIFPSISKDGD